MANRDLVGDRRIGRRHRGFGSELIEHVMAYDFGGTGKLEFKPDGLVCVLSLPLSDEMRVNGVELETGTGRR